MNFEKGKFCKEIFAGGIPCLLKCDFWKFRSSRLNFELPYFKLVLLTSISFLLCLLRTLKTLVQLLVYRCVKKLEMWILKKSAQSKVIILRKKMKHEKGMQEGRLFLLLCMLLETFLPIHKTLKYIIYLKTQKNKNAN